TRLNWSGKYRPRAGESGCERREAGLLLRSAEELADAERAYHSSGVARRVDDALRLRDRLFRSQPLQEQLATQSQTWHTTPQRFERRPGVWSNHQLSKNKTGFSRR